MLSLVLITIGNAAMPYYAIDNRMSSLMSYEYKVSFNKTIMLEKFCKHSIAVQDHPVDSVRSSHCYTKCAMDNGADPDCTDFHSDTDLPTEPSLCVSRDTLFTLCAMLEECWGVTHNTGLAHGYLLTSACQSPTAIHPKEGRDIYVKTLEDKYEACELGVGAELIGSAYPEVAGVYEQRIKDGMIMYAQVQPELGSKLTWHHTGCGWVISRNIATYKPPMMMPDPVCPDNNPAANALFEQDGMDYDPKICETAGQVWGEGSYCANPIFAAVCPASCMAPCGDSDAGMRQLLGADMLNVPEDKQGGCDSPAVLENCGNIIASALCPSKSRRVLAAASRRQRRRAPLPECGSRGSFAASWPTTASTRLERSLTLRERRVAVVWESSCQSLACLIRRTRRFTTRLTPPFRASSRTARRACRTSPS
jgi:hypothetical protein